MNKRHAKGETYGRKKGPPQGQGEGSGRRPRRRRRTQARGKKDCAGGSVKDKLEQAKDKGDELIDTVKDKFGGR
jgi:hypothetical protein